MEKKAETENRVEAMRQRFDATLKAHMERLLGVKHGPGGLPLNLLNVSCLVLLAEQQVNEDKQFCTVADRYTKASLFRELAEIGFESEADFDGMLAQMQARAYVCIDANGLIAGGKPALETARLIDTALPQMPGLNLIAYIAQTVDEAMSGRKALDDAVDQFDQTLMLQGVSAADKEAGSPKGGAADKSPDGGPSTGGASAPSSGRGPRKAMPKKALSAEDLNRLREAVSRHQSTEASDSGSRIISLGADIQAMDVKVVSFGTLPTDGEPPTQEQDNEAGTGGPRPDPAGGEVAAKQPRQPEADGHDQGARLEMSAPEQTGQPAETGNEDAAGQVQPDEKPLPDGVGPEAVSGAGAGDVEDSGPPEVEKPLPAALEDGVAIQPAGQDRQIEAVAPLIENQDDAVAARISSFEADLSLQCPVCGSGKIVAEKTAKSRIYYKCSGRGCNFISWGKPRHQECPRCHNPFLIEQEKKGRTLLKCPRATCNHWQDEAGNSAAAAFPGHDLPKTDETRNPRRRVVKRRVVRRKKA